MHSIALPEANAPLVFSRKNAERAHGADLLAALLLRSLVDFSGVIAVVAPAAARESWFGISVTSQSHPNTAEPVGEAAIAFTGLGAEFVPSRTAYGLLLRSLAR